MRVEVSVNTDNRYPAEIISPRNHQVVCHLIKCKPFLANATPSTSPIFFYTNSMSPYSEILYIQFSALFLLGKLNECFAVFCCCCCKQIPYVRAYPVFMYDYEAKQQNYAVLIKNRLNFCRFFVDSAVQFCSCILHFRTCWCRECSFFVAHSSSHA